MSHFPDFLSREVTFGDLLNKWWDLKFLFCPEIVVMRAPGSYCPLYQLEVSFCQWSELPSQALANYFSRGHDYHKPLSTDMKMVSMPFDSSRHLHQRTKIPKLHLVWVVSAHTQILPHSSPFIVKISRHPSLNHPLPTPDLTSPGFLGINGSIGAR
jgi:hypothetical protein